MAGLNASNHHALVFSAQLNQPGEVEIEASVDRESRRKQIESQLLLSTSPLSPPPLRPQISQDLEPVESGNSNEYFLEKRAPSPPSTPSTSVMPPANWETVYPSNGFYNGNLSHSSNGGTFNPREYAAAHSNRVQSNANYTRSSTSIAEPAHVSSSRMSSISSTANFFDRPEKKLVVPPLNFAMVAQGIYRSGHPLPINFTFLERLKLKTIIYLGENDMRAVNEEWAAKNGIKIYHFRMESCKLPFIENDPDAVAAALHVVLDSRNFPILMHSNKGKHRVGVLVGAMRKLLQRWSLATIFDEYSQFAAGKEDGDIEFIELFNAELHYDPKYAPSWLR